MYINIFYVNASLARKIMEDPCAGRVAQAVENGYSDVHPVGEVVMHTCKHAYMQTYIYTYVTYISLYLHTLSGTNMYTGYMYTYMHLLNTYMPVYIYIYTHNMHAWMQADMHSCIDMSICIHTWILECLLSNRCWTTIFWWTNHFPNQAASPTRRIKSVCLLGKKWVFLVWKCMLPYVLYKSVAFKNLRFSTTGT